MSRILFAPFLALALASPHAAAASPFGLSYGGRLAGDGGKAVDGPVDLELKFYRTVSGGTALPVSPAVFAKVALDDGVFQVDLDVFAPGELDSIFAAGADAFVEVTDRSHGITYPRQRFRAVPYALKVPVDGTSIGYDGEGRLSVGPAAAPADNQFLTRNGDGQWVWATPAAAPAASLSGQPIAQAAPTSGQVLKFDGNKWVGAPDLGGSGTVTNVTTTAPLAVTSGAATPAISLPKATGAADGYLAATDFALFAAKQTALGFVPLNSNGGALTGALSLGNNPINNLGAPSAPTDAANKAYVDAQTGLGLRKDGTVALTAAWNVGAQDLINLGHVKIGASRGLRLGNVDNTAEGTMTTGWGAGETGTSWYNTDQLAIRFWNGSAAQSLGVAGAGITAFNGQGNATQSLAVDTSAALSWSSSAGVHTLHIPLASGAGAGLLSAADYTSFGNKQSALGYTALDAAGTVSMTGNLNLGSQRITNLSDPTSASDAATKNFVTTGLNNKLNLTGGILTGPLAMSTQKITGLATPTAADDAATKDYADAALAYKAEKTTTISASGGLSGGGDLSANRTIVLDPAGTTTLGGIKLGSMIGLDGSSTVNAVEATSYSGTLGISNGGTGLNSAPANGQLLIGSGGGFALGSITGIGGVTVAGGAGSITVSVAGDSSKLNSGSPAFTGQIGGPAGSAASPSYAFTGDSDTGLFNPAGNELALATGGIERVHVDGSGNVGIGTNAPGFPLTLKASGGTAPMLAVNDNGGTTQLKALSDGTLQLKKLAPIAGAGGVIAVEPALTGSGATGVNVSNLSAVTASSGITDLMGVEGNFTPTSGTGEYNSLHIANTITQSGGATGVTRGLLIDGTLTNAADFRAIEAAKGNVVVGIGAVGIGTMTPQARLDIVAPSVASVGIAVKGAGAQTGNYFEARDGGNVVMARVTGAGELEAKGGFRQTYEGWVAMGITQNASGAQLQYRATASGTPFYNATALSGTSQAIIPIRDGSITGLMVFCGSSSISAGTLTITAYKDAVAISGAKVDLTSGSYAHATFALGTYNFSAGAALDLRYSSTSGTMPTACRAALEVTQ